MNCGLFDPERKIPDVKTWLAAEAHADRHDHHHHHDVNRHDEHIASFVLTADAAIPAGTLEMFLELLRATHGDKLLRVKGIVKLAEMPETPVVVHGVQHIFHPTARLERWPDDDHRTRLVFITRDLPERPCASCSRPSSARPRRPAGPVRADRQSAGAVRRGSLAALAPPELELMLPRPPATAGKSPRRGKRHATPSWLRQYPPGVPAEIDPSRYASLVAMFEDSFKAHAAREACVCMGKSLTYRRARPGLARLRRLAAEPRPATRRPRRHHDAERAAISGGDRRHPARRPDRRERQSAVQAARVGIPAQGLRRRSHHRAGEFRRGAARGVAANASQARRHRQHGRHARHAERRAGQHRGAPREEDGAGLRPARLATNSTTRLPRAASCRSRPRSDPTTSPSCNIPAAPPASPRARCCCTAIWSPICCRSRRGTSR